MYERSGRSVLPPVASLSALPTCFRSEGAFYTDANCKVAFDFLFFFGGKQAAMFRSARDCLILLLPYPRSPDDIFCLIRQVRQQHISTFEITDLSSSQMKADRSALIIAHGMKF